MEADLANLSQSDAATLMQVDRTTIRAWTEAGMPYTPPETKGKEARYSAFVLMHWRLWVAFRKEHNIGKLEPLQAIAVMRAFTALDDDVQGLDDYFRLVPKALAPHLNPAEARHVLDFALGYAAAWRARTVRH